MNNKQKILEAVENSLNGYISINGLFINHNGISYDGKPLIHWDDMTVNQIDSLYRLLSNWSIFDGKIKKIICGHCGFKALPTAFYRGRGREYGEHPDHTYCPHCGQSITWHGCQTIREEPDYCDQCNGTDPECGWCEYVAPYPRRRQNLKEVM
jgi:hypothetical protein